MPGPLSPELEYALRCMRRGGMLDKHHRETGLSAFVGTDPQTGLQRGRGAGEDLLRLNSSNLTNPEGVVVSVGVTRLSEENLAVGFSPFELVLRSGTGKASSPEVVMDLRQGTQFVVPANTIQLAVRIRDDDLITPVVVLPFFRVDASIGYGTRPGGTAAVTWTSGPSVPIVNGAVMTPIAIPPYATRVAWSSREDPTVFAPPDALLRFLPDTGGGGRIEQQSNPGPDEFIQIPQGANFIEIENIGGLASYFLVFELTL